jgi:hypothetical protein
MKKLLFLIIAGGLVYLNYTNPTREEHEVFLRTEMQAMGPVSDEQFEKMLKDVDFSNFMVCSASKTTLDSRIISFGYLKEIRLINDQWVKANFEKLQKQRGY